MVQSIGSLQKEYSVGAFELLSKTAPIQVVSLLVFCPFINYYPSGRLPFVQLHVLLMLIEPRFPPINKFQPIIIQNKLWLRVVSTNLSFTRL